MKAETKLLILEFTLLILLLDNYIAVVCGFVTYKLKENLTFTIYVFSYVTFMLLYTVTRLGVSNRQHQNWQFGMVHWIYYYCSPVLVLGACGLLCFYPVKEPLVLERIETWVIVGLYWLLTLHTLIYFWYKEYVRNLKYRLALQASNVIEVDSKWIIDIETSKFEDLETSKVSPLEVQLRKIEIKEPQLITNMRKNQLVASPRKSSLTLQKNKSNDLRTLCSKRESHSYNVWNQSFDSTFDRTYSKDNCSFSCDQSWDNISQAFSIWYAN